MKKHKYPPEGMEDAVQIVVTKCELWTDGYDFEEGYTIYSFSNQTESELALVAEEKEQYS